VKAKLIVLFVLPLLLLGSVGLNLAPNLVITKRATPETVTRQGVVTSTITLNNSGSDADRVLLYDTLPLSTTFARWVELPPGPIIIFGPPEQIVWGGPVAAGETITVTFVVSHTADPGDQVTNTAEYSHSSGSGSSQATFAVEAVLLYLPLVMKP
jgi:uncharacterized repeat protein (TIGR01451 family)